MYRLKEVSKARPIGVPGTLTSDETIPVVGSST
jgi:hypothetical protein